MNLFKKKVDIRNFVPVTGNVLIEKTENVNVFKVLDVAKNVNYDGARTEIQKDDLVICSEYLYSNSFKINGKKYFSIKPKQIIGHFEGKKK
ncbi:hypothetical protein [uncultured Algibacter sp.]|uniref:hypothetical protein n=1 Tax=uncultured Algibacter sp. TaxID=298659 RepID=UPI0030EF1343|tara:strand:- start:1469 stop:1741 length:273 start_codon:yes stop_codon:yes gene_type:complete